MAVDLVLEVMIPVPEITVEGTVVTMVVMEEDTVTTAVATEEMAVVPEEMVAVRELMTPLITLAPVVTATMVETLVMVGIMVEELEHMIQLIILGKGPKLPISTKDSLETKSICSYIPRYYFNTQIV
ncbi:hypothetical protein K7432_004077 [Basidiobolus ranarum]|uniref:Uncharacterized protein n=1 Tax=Basidiobolus ranarum TaxID=34480 RepID=A0ABR2W5N2_9FUNG